MSAATSLQDWSVTYKPGEERRYDTWSLMTTQIEEDGVWEVIRGTVNWDAEEHEWYIEWIPGFAVFPNENLLRGLADLLAMFNVFEGGN